MSHRQAERVGLHADGRFCAFEKPGDLRHRGLVLRMLLQRLEIGISPALVTALLPLLRHFYIPTDSCEGAAIVHISNDKSTVPRWYNDGCLN